MKVAILGAGHGGNAMAADLCLAGHEVRLAAVAEHSSNLLITKSFGGIYLQGITSSGAEPGFAKLHMITTEVARAVKGAEVIFIVVPAFAQECYMEELVKCTEPGQVVVFCPGKFASLVFYKKMKNAGKADDVIIGETMSLLYAAKIKGPGHVRIKVVKSDLYFAAMPSKNTADALFTLYELFEQFVPSKNVLQTSLDDIGMTLHPVTTLMNASRIEQMGPYRNAHYDITPSVGRVIEAVDAERTKISGTLHCEALSFLETYDLIYGIKGKSAYETVMSVDAYNIQMSPDSLKHRYVSEEVPYSLVPTLEIANAVGIEAPGIESIIHMASLANDTDYKKEGRNLDSMGIMADNVKDLVDYVTKG